MEASPSKTSIENPKETTVIEMEDEINVESQNTELLDNKETEEHTKNLSPKQESNVKLTDCKDVLENTRCDENRKNVYEIYDMNVPHRNPFQRQRSILVYFEAARPIATESEPLQYDPSSRNGFIRLVFTLVFIMLCSTISVAAAGHFISPFRDFLTSPPGALVLIGMSLLAFTLHYVMYCSNCSRKPPLNYVCLALATIAYSYIVAAVTLRYKTVILAGAFVGTAAIAFVCILLAMSNFDFTKFLLYVILISVAVSAVFLAYIMGKIFFGLEMKPLHIGLLLLLTALNAIMLIMQLQMILGGKTVELGVDDYALGAYMLYVSIITLFLRLLEILRLLDED